MHTSLALILSTTLAALGLATGAAAQSAHPLDLGVHYTYDRHDINPLTHARNGGGLQLVLGLTRYVDATADVTFTANQNVQRGFLFGPTGTTDQIVTYLAGVRLYANRRQARLRPFLEGMAGGASSLGQLAPPNFISGASQNTFAFTAGGGLTVRLSPRVMLVPVTASFLETNFANGGSDHEGTLRLSSGFLFRFR